MLVKPLRDRNEAHSMRRSSAARRGSRIAVAARDTRDALQHFAKNWVSGSADKSFFPPRKRVFSAAALDTPATPAALGSSRNHLRLERTMDKQVIAGM